MCDCECLNRDIISEDDDDNEEDTGTAIEFNTKPALSLIVAELEPLHLHCGKIRGVEVCNEDKMNYFVIILLLFVYFKLINKYFMFLNKALERTSGSDCVYLRSVP